MSDIQETWNVHNKINYLLLDSIPAKAMSDQYTDKTRTVAAQFAHMHNVRIHHLKGRGRKFLGKLKTFERGAQPTKSELKKALKDSEKAVATMLAACEETGKVPSWQNSVTTYLGYFISHESHHRGLVMVCLRFGGTKHTYVQKYGIWEGWKKRL